MNQMSSTKKATITAICIALCYVLPVAFHALGVGSYVAPMHIPVLLCGLVCGPGYGLFCGIAGPIISSTTGMPTMTQLLYFVPELMSYGLVCGLMLKLVRTKNTTADIYLAMATAMLLGRVVGGIARALVISLLGTGEVFHLTVWATSYFLSAIPGIITHLILVPLLYLTLERAGMIPRRYGKGK